MTRPDPSASLRHHAATIAAGVAGVSTLALLAAGSALALFAGASAAPAVLWLGSLGTNALASWLDQWARTNLSRAMGDDPDAEIIPLPYIFAPSFLSYSNGSISA
jgi:hypothetical protein